jgi:hypothetical protein
MRNYLSQIVNRARGVAETDHIKPTSQGWPVAHAEAVSDPFEEIESVESSPAPVPEENAESLTADRVPEDAILPDTPGQEKRSSDVPSEQPSRLSPRPSPDFKVPPLSDEKEDETTEQLAPDQSDNLPPHPVPESSTASDVKDVPPEIKQPIPRDIDNAQYAKEEKGVSQQPTAHSLPPGDLELETRDWILETEDSMPVSSIRQTDRGEREPVSELRPRPPISPVTPPVYRKDSQENRLVIGRLRVEVIKAPPVTTQKRAVRITPRRQQPQPESGIFRSKLRFGLGQM